MAVARSGHICRRNSELRHSGISVEAVALLPDVRKDVQVVHIVDVGVPAFRRRARGLRPAPRAESRPSGFDP